MTTSEQLALDYEIDWTPILRDSRRAKNGTWHHATVGRGCSWHEWAQMVELGLRVSLYLQGVTVKGIRT